ncbi:hypothetical protein BDZ97DRAFT_1808359 [Flammula alnicola]|nr:hypothetical protein BDZ97DRAFT_1808359 [Flammula alnicola]
MRTCKQGSFGDSTLVIEMLRQAWKMSLYGDRLQGFLWSIAFDGDPKRHPALYLHHMVRELPPDNPGTKRLFSLVGGFPGLNLWTGSEEYANFSAHAKASLSIMLSSAKAFLPCGLSTSPTLIGPMTQFSPSSTLLSPHHNLFILS